MKEYENNAKLEKPVSEGNKPDLVSDTPHTTDDLSSAAADIAASLEQNQKVSPAANSQTPAKPREGWRREPLRNFKTDAKGQVRLRADGSPVRRGGKPGKPKVGEMLADGSRYGVDDGGGGQGESKQGEVSRVVVPDQQQEQQQGGPEPARAELGPEAGRVVSQLCFNMAKRKGGDKFEPTPDERRMIEEAAAGSLNGRRVPWLLVLPVALAAYLLARVEFKPKKKQEEKQDGANASRNHRADAERQDATGEATSPTSWAAW